MKPSFEQHCTEESLELYALGQLDEANTETLEEHILICEPCRVRLDEEDRVARAMSGASARLRQEPVKDNLLDISGLKKIGDLFRMPAPAWAAAAAAACLVVVVTSTQLRHESLENETPVAVSLKAERGEPGNAPARRILDLKLDARGLALGAKVRVDVVDSRGAKVEEDVAAQVGNTIELKTHKALSKGGYLVRIFGPGSFDSAREFSLVVR